MMTVRASQPPSRQPNMGHAFFLHFVQPPVTTRTGLTDKTERLVARLATEAAQCEKIIDRVDRQNGD